MSINAILHVEPLPFEGLAIDVGKALQADGQPGAPFVTAIVRHAGLSMHFQSTKDLDRLISAAYDAKAAMVALAPPPVDKMPRCKRCGDSGYIRGDVADGEQSRTCPERENHR